MTDTTVLAPVVAEHIAAVNAFDQDAIVATFADDALVNDAHREFWGREAIRAWVAREMVGDRVRIEVTEVLDHHGDTIVRGRYDGDYDKTNLPGRAHPDQLFHRPRRQDRHPHHHPEHAGRLLRARGPLR
jgi:hypothetical protein